MSGTECCFKVNPLFCTGPHLLCMTLRHKRWRRFSPVVLREVTKAPFETQIILTLGRTGGGGAPPCTMVGVWICVYVRGLSDCDNYLQLKKCWSWNSPKSLHAKWSFEAEFLVPLNYFVVFLRWKENGDPLLLLLFFFTRYGCKKNFFKDKKICTIGVVLFRYERHDTSHLAATEKYEMMIKLSMFLTFLQDRVIWSHFTEKL